VRKATRRLLALGSALAVLGGGVGTAYAMGWLVFGSAQFRAGTTNIQALNVYATTVDSSALYPGGSIPISVTVENTNAGPVTLTKIEASSIQVDDSFVVRGCESSSYTFVAPPLDPAPTLGSYSWSDDSDKIVLEGAKVAMSADAPLACASAGITVTLRATGSLGGTPASTSSTG
jgi:hypothetical protein